jgi:hypothetical protein
VTLLSAEDSLSDLWSSRCEYCTLKGFDCGEKQSEFGHMKTRRDQHRTDEPAPYRMKPLPLAIATHTPGWNTRVDFTPRGSVFYRRDNANEDERSSYQFHQIYHPERLDTCAVWLQEKKVLFEDRAADERFNRKVASALRASSEARVQAANKYIATGLSTIDFGGYIE